MKLWLMIIGACAVLTACVPHNVPQIDSSSSSSTTMLVEKIALVSPTGKKVPLTVEIARTQEQHSRGLMERTSLASDHGMLFVFDAPEELSFWMKNTKIPLEVLYFDAQGTFVFMQSMVPCVSDRCLSYPSYGLSQYALEVNSGFTATHDIGAGWRIDYVMDGPK